MTDAVQILAITDDLAICNLIHTSLGADGHAAICVPSAAEALQLLQQGIVTNFLLIDAARSKSRDDLFLPALLQHSGVQELCLLTEPGDTSWESHAAKWKISLVFTRPLLRHDLNKLIARSSINSSRPIEPASTSSGATRNFHLEELDNNRFFLAASPVMMHLYRDIRLLAPVDIPVLILGESGAGKEVVAMLLHKYHARSDKKFLNVNCAALPTDLLESELFGYEAGAFTGASTSKPGKFELANKGTILLDEIGEMSPPMQAKLLHVLQDGSFCRLGARVTTHVDVRVLAATNINMQQALVEKRFREDLYYRLNTLTITVPPLRDRREEIPLLIEQIVARGSSEYGQDFRFSSRLFEAAQDYHWPGNLRELRNFVTRTLILQNEEVAYNDLRAQTRAHAPATMVSVEAPRQESPADSNLPVVEGMRGVVNGVKKETEIRMLQNALAASGWNRRRAAVNLNISYRTLLYKIQQHGLTAQAYHPPQTQQAPPKLPLNSFADKNEFRAREQVGAR
jgi:two-component system response regulator AtoC